MPDLNDIDHDQWPFIDEMRADAGISSMSPTTEALYRHFE